MGEIRRFLSFYVKISQNWLKILGCPQNFWRITHTKKKVFFKRTGEIRRFLSFYVKISQNWLKFLGFTQNFGLLHLKM